MARRSIKHAYYKTQQKKQKQQKQLHTNTRPPPPSTPPPRSTPNSNTSILGSIAGGLLHGFSFGAGSEIAHKTIETVAGPRTIHIENNNTDLNCLQIQELYNKCLTVPNNECSHIHDMLIKFNCNSI